jgi:hypothetical protein
MFDALEAIHYLSTPLIDSPYATRDFDVGKLYLDSLSVLEHSGNESKPISFLRRAIFDLESNKDDDAYNTSVWCLAFAVEMLREETNIRGELVDKFSYPHGTTTAKISYCCRSEISRYQWQFIAEGERKLDESARKKGKYRRTLFAQFHPMVGRVFGTHLFENMRDGLKLMRENIDTSISDEDLADLVNSRNNALRAKFLGAVPKFETSGEAVRWQR